jgi:hypothetical protein
MAVSESGGSTGIVTNKRRDQNPLVLRSRFDLASAAKRPELHKPRLRGAEGRRVDLRRPDGRVSRLPGCGVDGWPEGDHDENTTAPVGRRYARRDACSDLRRPQNSILLYKRLEQSAVNNESSTGPKVPENDPVTQALNLRKTQAEIDKITEETIKVRVDAALAPRLMRLQYRTAFYSTLVPLASILAILATVYTSNQTNRQLQDAETKKLQQEADLKDQDRWLKFEERFNNSTKADDLYKQPTFVLEFSSYARSAKFRENTLFLSKWLLGNVTTIDAFTELWSFLYEPLKTEQLPAVVAIDKTHLDAAFASVDKCKTFQLPASLQKAADPFSYAGPCNASYTKADLSKAYPKDDPNLPRILALMDRTGNENLILDFVSRKISDLLRKTSPIGSPQSYDLSNVAIRYSNVDGVDFSNANLANVSFFYATVKDAVFAPTPPNTMTTDFFLTPWWKAAQIDPQTLAFLVANKYPNSDDEQFSADIPSVGLTISEDAYRADIKRLCKNNAPFCAPACIKFGRKPKPVPDTCSAN